MQQGVLSSSLYGSCQAQVEDQIHALCLCAKVNQIWNLRCSNIIPLISSATCFDVLVYSLTEVDMSIVSSFLTIAWGMWKFRNSILFEKDCVSVEECVDKCVQYVESFNVIKNSQAVVKKRRFCYENLHKEVM